MDGINSIQRKYVIGINIKVDVRHILDKVLGYGRIEYINIMLNGTLINITQKKTAKAN